MVELKIPRAHSNDWYDNLANNQAGYSIRGGLRSVSTTVKKVSLL
jgi:hypothetical protein